MKDENIDCSDIKEKKHHFETDETAQQRIEQAQKLKKISKEGGLRFDVYLPPSIALWILDLVEKGDFIDPSEAAFVFLGQAQDFDDNAEIKRDILTHRLAKGEKNCDQGHTSSSMKDIRDRMIEKMKRNPETAVWQKISQK